MPQPKTEVAHRPYVREEDPEIKLRQEEDLAAAQSAGLTNEEPAEGEEIIIKRHASAFFGTELVSKLTLLGVDTLVVCGVSTSGEFRRTSADRRARGFANVS